MSSFAALPALEEGLDGTAPEEFLQELLHRLRCPVYDGSDVPTDLKTGITLGMSMTEKQGGSDVRANTTQAIRATAPTLLTLIPPYTH